MKPCQLFMSLSEGLWLYVEPLNYVFEKQLHLPHSGIIPNNFPTHAKLKKTPLVLPLKLSTPDKANKYFWKCFLERLV